MARLLFWFAASSVSIASTPDQAARPAQELKQDGLTPWN